MPERLAPTILRVQTVRLRRESRLRGSRASLNSNCQKTGESIHLQRRHILHATSSSTLSNSTNGLPDWQRRSLSEDASLLELAHPPVRGTVRVHWGFVIRAC